MLTAVLLGVVSLTTALGAWQATTWTRQAADYGESSSDARDANITRSIDWQGYYRIDNAAVLQARKFALLEDEATASGDFVAAAYSNVMVGNQLGRSVNRRASGPPSPIGAQAGFPPDESPTSDPGYVAELRGDADSYSIVSALAGGFKDALQGKAVDLHPGRAGRRPRPVPARRRRHQPAALGAVRHARARRGGVPRLARA